MKRGSGQPHPNKPPGTQVLCSSVHQGKRTFRTKFVTWLPFREQLYWITFRFFARLESILRDCHAQGCRLQRRRVFWRHGSVFEQVNKHARVYKFSMKEGIEFPDCSRGCRSRLFSYVWFRCTRGLCSRYHAEVDSVQSQCFVVSSCLFVVVVIFIFDLFTERWSTEGSRFRSRNGHVRVRTNVTSESQLIFTNLFKESL